VLIPTLTIAEISPPQGEFDPRVRVVDYNPLNVVKLSTFYGVSTHVQFGDDETIKDIAIGDDQAWKVVPRKNHLFIKPQATQADTNLTVVTDKRTYQFALIVQAKSIKDSKAWKNPNLIFSLTFNYPDEQEASRQIALNKASAKADLNAVKHKLSDATQKIDNMNYWVAGSEEISPTKAHDDGRFIYLTFSNNRDMPAVYSVDSDNNEALINTNVIDGNTLVIQRLVAHLMLRKGNYVASVINKSFDINGGTDNQTGTIAPDVERVIKEVE
jgi:type IV secretion system protein VirB9